jgi:hypothetical protein
MNPMPIRRRAGKPAYFSSGCRHVTDLRNAPSLKVDDDVATDGHNKSRVAASDLAGRPVITE